MPTLDEIRAAADKKYGSTDIDLDEGRVCKLRNVLRLQKEERDELKTYQELLKADDADQAEVLGEMLRIVAADKETAEELLLDIDGDLAVLMTLFREWSSGTELPEASASPS